MITFLAGFWPAEGGAATGGAATGGAAAGGAGGAGDKYDQPASSVERYVGGWQGNDMNIR